MREIILFVIMFLVISGIVALIVWNGKREQRRQERVKPLLADSAGVMSRASSETPQEPLSSHRQTALQTDRPAAPSHMSRDVMLDIYRLLRAHNVPREKARPALKAAGIPLDNNLWTEAAPPDDDTILTPIAGRPTKASYYPDSPDLDYQPPPR